MNQNNRIMKCNDIPFELIDVLINPNNNKTPKMNFFFENNLSTSNMLFK